MSELRIVRNQKKNWYIGGLAVLAAAVLGAEFAGGWIAIASCLVLVLSLFIATRVSSVFDLHHLGITNFWYLSYLVMIFFPAFVVYEYQYGRYTGAYLFAVETVLITVPLGWCCATWLWAGKKEEIEWFYDAELSDGVPARTLMLRFWVLLIACLALVLAYVHEVKTIPLLYLIKNPGDAIEAALLREESFKTLDSRLTYFYYLVRGTFYPVMIAIALGAYLRFRGKAWFFTFAISLITGITFAALTIAKSPVALIVLVVSIFYYLYRGGRLSRKSIAVLLMLVLLFPIAVFAYLAHADSDTGWIVLEAVAYRLFYLPSEVVYYYFEVFPNHIPFQYGRGTDKIAKVLGVDYFDVPNVVGTYAYPYGLESISANAAFISNFYADFGWPGVLMGGLMAGFIMQSAQIYTIRRRKTIGTLALFAFLIVIFWFLNSTSLPIVLVSDGAILSAVVAWYFDRSGPGEVVRVSGGSGMELARGS